MASNSYIKTIDWWLIIVPLMIVGIGLLSLRSSSLGLGSFLNFHKQIIFLGVGLVLMFLMSFFDWRILRNNSYLILLLYFLCVVALIGLFFMPAIRGVRSWYRVGPISIDPIEPMKLVLIILLAKYFSMRHVEMYRFQHIILSGFYVLIPSVLISRQPDIGSAAILVAIWIGILLISGIRIKHFLILCLCAVLVFILSWNFLLKDYQKDRLISFAAPDVEPLGIGWSQNQSKIAIGSGGLMGEGIGKGSQTQYGFLPEPQTDFIFAAIAEETGLMGLVSLFLLFGVLLWRIIRIAVRSLTNFPRLFAFGLAILIVCQIFVNVGMNLGLLPIIGIPLPFVSYGGSGLVALFIGLGVLQNIRRSV